MWGGLAGGDHQLWSGLCGAASTVLSWTPSTAVDLMQANVQVLQPWFAVKGRSLDTSAVDSSCLVHFAQL